MALQNYQEDVISLNYKLFIFRAYVFFFLDCSEITPDSTLGFFFSSKLLPIFIISLESSFIFMQEKVKNIIRWNGTVVEEYRIVKWQSSGIVRQSLGIVRQLSGSCQAVVRQLSGSCQLVLR